MRAFAIAFSLLIVAPAFAQKEFGFDNRKGSGQACGRKLAVAIWLD